MVHSPSKVWKDGVLVERAISTPVDDETDEVEPKATKPHKTPVATRSAANRKRVDAAENKAVKKADSK